MCLKKKEEEPDLFVSFKLSLFIRALSYRDFLTSFSLVLLLLALFQLIDYYSYEEFLEHIDISSIRVILWIIFFILSHVIYKVEHNRSNNFIGRVMHDTIFIFVYALSNKLLWFLYGSHITHEVDISGTLTLILGILISITLFEIVVAVVKRLLMLFKWQIL